MATLSATPVSVYPLTEQWNFTINAYGKSGTRVYLDTDQTLSGDKVDLPRIGDSWDGDFTNVTAKTMAMSYLSNDNNCGRKFIISYDDNILGGAAEPLSSDELYKTVDVSGELVSWEPKKEYSAYWSSDLVNVHQPLFKIANMATVRMYHIVRHFDVYLRTVMRLANTVNGGWFFNFPPGMVLFEGANFQEFDNRGNYKRYRVELIFSMRNVTDDFTNNDANGWNYILREDNFTWDVPQFYDVGSIVPDPAGDRKLYLSRDHSALFEDELGDSENLFEAPPER